MPDWKALRRRLTSFTPPTLGEALRWLVRLPLRLLKFVVLLPYNLIKFLVHLPRNIWRAWTAGARGIVRLEGWLAVAWGYIREARRWQRILLPRETVVRFLYSHLHPRRVWHALCAWRPRLRPALWDARPGLAAVRGALNWARQLRRHRSRFEDIDALRSILYADDTVLEEDPLRPTLGLRARQTTLNRRRGALLHGLVRYSGAQRIIELGAGYGISSLYLARGLADNYPTHTCLLIALEPDSKRARHVTGHLQRLGYQDFTEVRQGDLEKTLSKALKDAAPLNLAFINMPATEEALLRDFSQIKRHARAGALIILTGIHASPARHHTWTVIRQMPQIAASVDLWEWGIIVIGRGPALHLCARL